MVKLNGKVISFKIYECPVCGMKSILPDLCNGCLNVQKNIKNYLKTKEGIKRIKEYLRKAEGTQKKEKKGND